MAVGQCRCQLVHASGTGGRVSGYQGNAAQISRYCNVYVPACGGAAISTSCACVFVCVCVCEFQDLGCEYNLLFDWFRVPENLTLAAYVLECNEAFV